MKILKLAAMLAVAFCISAPARAELALPFGVEGSIQCRVGATYQTTKIVWLAPSRAGACPVLLPLQDALAAINSNENRRDARLALHSRGALVPTEYYTGEIMSAVWVRAAWPGGGFSIMPAVTVELKEPYVDHDGKRIDQLLLLNAWGKKGGTLDDVVTCDRVCE